VLESNTCSSQRSSRNPWRAAHLARETAAQGVWRRLVTDPLSGTVLDYGRTTYHPPAGPADHVRVRDLHCRFPLCRRRAADAELDHVIAWADGGETSDRPQPRRLLPAPPPAEHHAGWKVEAHPDGRLTWITPPGAGTPPLRTTTDLNHLMRQRQAHQHRRSRPTPVGADDIDTDPLPF
jgi:hypothetical protein